MTIKESEKALKLYDELGTILFYHNKNLTKAQYYLLDDIRDFLRQVSEKAYRKGQ